MRKYSRKGIYVLVYSKFQEWGRMLLVEQAGKSKSVWTRYYEGVGGKENSKSLGYNVIGYGNRPPVDYPGMRPNVVVGLCERLGAVDCVCASPAVPYVQCKFL